MPQTRPISRGKWRSSYLSFVSRGDLMKWAVVFCLFWASSAAAQGRDLDLVLAGGRVLDPETGLDAERDVGIASGSIAAVYEGSLSSRLKPGGTLIDARGLIVGPGFIDPRSPGPTDPADGGPPRGKGEPSSTLGPRSPTERFGSTPCPSTRRG